MNPDQPRNNQYTSLPSPQPMMSPLPLPGQQNNPNEQASIPQLQQMPTPSPSPMAPSNIAQQPPVGATSAVFSDEQWANEARRIIAETSEDPFAQTERLYQLRVQYMQQVHGKEMKQGGFIV